MLLQMESEAVPQSCGVVEGERRVFLAVGQYNVASVESKQLGDARCLQEVKFCTIWEIGCFAGSSAQPVQNS